MRKPRLTGMVCNRKPTNLRKEPNLISQRKRQVKTNRKNPFKCVGGLLGGETLYLSSPGTMAFSIGGCVGFCDHKMEWVQL